MTEYELDFGWVISVPKGWSSERDNGEYIFYPDGSDTTLYAAVFHAEKDGQPADDLVMREIFLSTVPTDNKKLAVYSKLCCETFLIVSEGIYRICCGFFFEGELMSVNLYSKDEKETTELFEKIYSTIRIVKNNR